VTSKSLSDPLVYSFSGIRRMLGLSRHAVTQLIELGFVAPARGVAGAYHFSFRDVVLLRSAHALRGAGIPTRQILRSLRRLKNALPPDAPLGSLRITATGDRVTVADPAGHWEPETGQLVMDFSLANDGASVSFMPVAAADPEGDESDVDRLFSSAEAAEETDPASAEVLYRRVLALVPDHAHAYLNLGFMLCESKRAAAAVALYDVAVRHCAEDPLVHYNRAVALAAVGRNDDALMSYEACLLLEPELADAHENAALLYAQVGREQMAIRHFSAYRRLQRKL
jgi:tetratricopeptide (TPR) repeat protein